ncbi:uncharacterized protein Z518_07529 [Rhinocladiella mackenziei CBS 650.93]|uniref:Tetraspanin Tsp3 n=1 Tax=Rhinocladiella mackenziei CBS 650.93 TaxID=1442369 RepID=A0A0D2IL98_9EURO|nr:uncharacterized protein Z518_07529 [Rhinocladiella mackenziei CBS 650.93]KIX03976.1 hypothetical protein Z518_07529 [Rhinocladiella mackenziei CBS 650.93]
MDSRTKLLLFCLIPIAIISITLSAIAWSKIVTLSLPAPLSLPVFNTLIPIVAPILTPLAARFAIGARKTAATLLLPYLRELWMSIPLILFVLATVYAAPSDLLSCGMQTRWGHLFQNKDEQGIRAIQTALCCCGFNSLHDRAWPFPSRDVDAGACERTQGYTIRCADPWQRQESTAAALTALSSVLNWILLHVVEMLVQQNRRTASFPAISGAATDQTRLIGTEGDEEDRGENLHQTYSGAE